MVGVQSGCTQGLAGGQASGVDTHEQGQNESGQGLAPTGMGSGQTADFGEWRLRSFADGNVRGAVEGVRIRWILYRGPANVKFDPEVSAPVYGKPLTSETNVTFSAPGDYRIRAIASDGALFSTYDIDVKVNPS